MAHRTLAIRSLALLGGLLVLSDCAGASEPKLAVCDGKHRRPANPYGSVLPTVAGSEVSNAPDAHKPAATAALPATAPVSPPTSSPGPRASLDPRSFAPCGEGA